MQRDTGGDPAHHESPAAHLVPGDEAAAVLDLVGIVVDRVRDENERRSSGC
ncbi:hypothetical protein I550_5258 [Mycobacterium intracellulare 1956]|uniref:Uncharacterized protein n=1 Tax=Mycobacterium intracellulare 1956 TaxID=1299331 RepID=X8CEA4_MYCIT|nr:hypothetical protein I550_5258 [Mycobacterium intracellulare 1956]